MSSATGLAHLITEAQSHSSENTVQELRTKAQNMAANFLDRADTADWEPYNSGSTGTTSGSSGSTSSGSGSSGSGSGGGGY